MSSKNYRGRFAPSPTGPLHMGSLFAAVVSYLHARAQKGEWLVRIEDLDPPREQADAKVLIQNTLAKHGFKWDGEILYQSTRSEAYEAKLKQLAGNQLSYSCPCSRKQLSENGGLHSKACQSQEVSGLACAIKFRAPDKAYTWQDEFQGTQSSHIPEDFVLKRKDGLYAYQLAVVCDDTAQGITHVIRGSDLLDSTPMQLALYEAFGATPPVFSHFPVIVADNQQKLSKQNLAPAVNDGQALENLSKVFTYLNLQLSEPARTPEHALNLAVGAWREAVPFKLNTMSIVE